jgi:Amt family ammonium transporter
VDDPIDASVVHGMGGLWGTIAAGLFNKSTGLLMAAHQGKEITAEIRGEAFGY